LSLRSLVAACVLFVAAGFVPILFWVYAVGGSALLALIFVRQYLALRHQISDLRMEPRVLSVGRMRRAQRFLRQVNSRSERFLRLLPGSRVIVCFVTVSVVALLVGAVIGASIVRIRNVGTIRAVGVEVYADEGLTEVLIEISWGMLNPGESRNFDAWIKNTGNDAQKLVLWTEGWDPVAAQDSISLSWSYDDIWIQPGTAVPVTFTLSVDPNVTGVTNFSFDIVIKGVA
jgi:hypothetical protein